MIKFMLEIKENNKVIANIPVDNIADTYYSILDQSTYTIRVYRQPQQCESISPSGLRCVLMEGHLEAHLGRIEWR